MTRDEANKLAHEICAAIGLALDEAGAFPKLVVPLPGTDVVFIRTGKQLEPCFNCGERHIVPDDPASYGDCLC
jgi:hypothetical protein